MEELVWIRRSCVLSVSPPRNAQSAEGGGLTPLPHRMTTSLIWSAAARVLISLKTVEVEVTRELRTEMTAVNLSELEMAVSSSDLYPRGSSPTDELNLKHQHYYQYIFSTLIRT